MLGYDDTISNQILSNCETLYLVLTIMTKKINKYYKLSLFTIQIKKTLQILEHQVILSFSPVTKINYKINY